MFGASTDVYIQSSFKDPTRTDIKLIVSDPEDSTVLRHVDSLVSIGYHSTTSRGASSASRDATILGTVPSRRRRELDPHGIREDVLSV